MKITTKRKTEPYINGINAYAGKWIIGSIIWNSLSSPINDKGQVCKYKGNIRLPGLKQNIGDFVTEEEAIEKIEKLLNYWLDGLNNDS